MDALLATNKKPPGTTTVPVHLPNDLHRKVITIAGRGKASELIVKCVREPISKLWAEWINAEHKKIDNGDQGKK